MADRSVPGLPGPSQEIGQAPLPRRERRKRELRSRILAAAGDLFAGQGFHDTRVAEICDRADIAHKTFFNHFPTKLHLLREIAHAGLERLLVEIEAIRRSDLSTPERLRRLFATVSGHMSATRPWSRELVTELVHATSGDRDERSDQAQRLHAAVASLVEAGIEQGDVTRRHDVRSLTELILGAYYVLIFDYANLDDFPVHERADAAARLLADALASHPEERDGPT